MSSKLIQKECELQEIMMGGPQVKKEVKEEIGCYKKSRNIMGLVYMVANLVFFSLSLILTKEVQSSNRNITAFEIFCISTGVQMVINAINLRISQ